MFMSLLFVSMIDSTAASPMFSYQRYDTRPQAHILGDDIGVRRL